MAEKPRVEKLIDSQQFKGFERLLKSARQFFCQIFSLL